MNAHSACAHIGGMQKSGKLKRKLIAGDFALQQKMPAKDRPARDRIVSAAKQLFAERGFHRTAMAELADYAQVSVGAIYRSFASKDDIIRAIILVDTEERLGLLKHDIDQVAAGAIVGEVGLERMITRWVSDRTDALDHEIVAEGHRNPEIARLIADICGQFRDLFRTLARLVQPALEETEAEGVAEILLACQFGMGNREFTHPTLNAPQTAAITTRLILRAIRNGSS